jgi:hypothetical protein
MVFAGKKQKLQIDSQLHIFKESFVLAVPGSARSLLQLHIDIHWSPVLLPKLESGEVAIQIILKK